MIHRQPEYGLEFLLAFDGRIHHLEEGYWLKFQIRRVETTMERPHGLSYSFTLHTPDGKRLVGFDNAHSIPAKGSRFKRRAPARDHWHRTERDPGRPYNFESAAILLRDFFSEAERVLSERGITMNVVEVEDKGSSR